MPIPVLAQPLLGGSGVVLVTPTPGSPVTLTTGAGNIYVVPTYNELTIECWGGGGAGGGRDDQSSANGRDTQIAGTGITTLFAEGGNSGVGANGGRGGIPTGGNASNLNGIAGDDINVITNQFGFGSGGDAAGPGGGIGGIGANDSGTAPGGGGSGNSGIDDEVNPHGGGAGGGGGGYCKSVWLRNAAGAPTAGQSLTYTVGALRAGPGSGFGGGDGARGAIKISWT